MNVRTDDYTQIVQLLETAKARTRANRRARNQARTDLRAQLLVRLTSGASHNPAAVLEFMNNRIRDLEMATEADAETTLVANLISNLRAADAWEKVSRSQREIPPVKPAL